MTSKTTRRWAALGVALALAVSATPVVLAQDEHRCRRAP